MSGFWELVTAIVLSLVINECSELSPWLAQKLIRWAARVRYPTRVEELSALIAERPGKLFKLVTATGFACAALTYRITHRKTAPVHSLTSRFLIRFNPALVTGMLLTGEVLLASVITNHMPRPLDFIILGAIAAFTTAAEVLVSTRLPAGWATAVMSFALYLTARVVLGSVPTIDEFLSLGGMAVTAGVSATCAIRLGNRLRFSVMAASSTILGGGLLTFAAIWATPMSTPSSIDALVMLSDLGFAFGFSAGVDTHVMLSGLGFAFGCSAGVGVLLWQVLCGRRPPQSSSEGSATHRDMTPTIAARVVAHPGGRFNPDTDQLPAWRRRTADPWTNSDAVCTDGQTS